MKDFKPEQKVVFKLEPFAQKNRFPAEDLREGIFNAGGILPKENEVLILVKPGGDGKWIVKGYEYNRLGRQQSISEHVLFPLEEISKEQTESISSDCEKFFEYSDVLYNEQGFPVSGTERK